MNQDATPLAWIQSPFSIKPTPLRRSRRGHAERRDRAVGAAGELLQLLAAIKATPRLDGRPANREGTNATATPPEESLERPRCRPIPG
jgi:hypothetical protein